MPVLYWLEFLFGVVVVIVAISQVIVPIKKGLPVFPFFRKTQKLHGELTKVNREIEDLKLEKEITKGKKRIENERKKL